MRSAPLSKIVFLQPFLCEALSDLLRTAAVDFVMSRPSSALQCPDVPQPPASRMKRARTDADGAHIDDGPLDHLFNLAKSNMDGLEVG